jgi:hypothetical protein
MKGNRTQNLPPLNVIHIELFPITKRPRPRLHDKFKFTQFTRLHSIGLKPLLQASLMNILESARAVARRYQKFGTIFFAVAYATHQHEHSFIYVIAVASASGIDIDYI